MFDRIFRNGDMLQGQIEILARTHKQRLAFHASGRSLKVVGATFLFKL